jgi:hypothetical protein
MLNTGIVATHIEVLRHTPAYVYDTIFPVNVYLMKKHLFLMTSQMFIMKNGHS